MGASAHVSPPRRAWVRSFVRVALAAVAFVATAAGAQEEASVGRPAPAFRLPVYDAAVAGRPSAGIDDFVGPRAADPATRVLLVSFMASFCAPCIKELPVLEALARAERGRGLRVLAVAIDREEEGQARIAALLAKHKVSFPVLKDRFNIVARRWLGLKSPLPSLFLVGRDGVVSAVHRGYSEDLGPLVARELTASLGQVDGGVQARPAEGARPPSDAGLPRPGRRE